ncbi:MAG TPA: hypothetical protein PLF76_06460 [Methanomassiliicoccaceae archaeon]|jgi:hypothetical protein|nr:hypothetical protein [Methanomassiliicoccaceae archaeon]
MTRIQLTLSMEPADEVKPRRPKKVYRLYLLSDRSANLLDQMRLVTGIPKQEIVERAIEIAAEVINESIREGSRSE